MVLKLYLWTCPVCRAAAEQAVHAQRACQQLRLILQNICSLSNMLVLLSSSSLSFQHQIVKKCVPVHSWCWGLDFETWDGCRVVCVPFASGQQRNMEDINYGTGSTSVPRERRTSCFVRPQLCSYRSQWTFSAALDTWLQMTWLTSKNVHLLLCDTRWYVQHTDRNGPKETIYNVRLLITRTFQNLVRLW